MLTEGIPDWTKRWNTLLHCCVPRRRVVEICFLFFLLHHLTLCCTFLIASLVLVHIVHTRRAKIVYWYWFFRACLCFFIFLYSLFIFITRDLFFFCLYSFVYCSVHLLSRLGCFSLVSFACLFSAFVWYSLFIVRSLSLPFVFVCVNVVLYCPLHFCLIKSF